MKRFFCQQGIFCSFLFISVSFLGCSKNSTEPEPEYELGKNYYTMDVDGDTREYYVHIPAGYNENIPTPIVFMLHGGSGTGEGTYNNSGWKELGETENIITVFPTAWSYCYNKSNGVLQNGTRWNSFPGIFEFCTGEEPRDDVKFLRQVITDLHNKFNIDANRIYLAGFSSGGQMAFRCAVEMSDFFAAIVQSAGTHQIDTVFTAVRNLPIIFEVGNRDETWFQNEIYPSLALFDDLLTNHSLFKKIVNVHTKSFNFEPTYTLSGDTSSVLTATFKGIPDGNRVFDFNLIEGLDHSYPNTINHPIHGANRHWEWMKRFTLP